ncbi:MAG: HAMP domain-containing sensor histidine kinase [Methanocalculus sp.]|uniref:sensor histidine kinase n=1 Tax=Methanocalculus sp. TaxID=2004547 RepID=UPI00272093BE|nr:HAMP domain-containing sensor histidine kinase [Methanocalculus sp.]MDO9540126.1 HAMP domain-containing sensor histidine kinase [Methanocalculus sp.]
MIILIIIIVSGLILNVNYHSSRENLESEVLSLQENTEFSLLQSIILVDRGLKLFDLSLDYKLNKEMDLFLSAYRDVRGDPAEIALDRLKTSFGEGYELYIINETGVIEYTTYSPDYLLDFSIYPQFYSRLTRIREGDQFISDRIAQDFSTGIFRKFVYHPTPDHRFILEISYTNDELQEIRSSLKILSATSQIKAMNPYLTSVRIFNWRGDEVGNSSYLREEERTSFITEVLDTREVLQIHKPESDQYTRYLFVNLQENGNPPEMNLVAELTYTKAPIRQQLYNLLITHLMIALFAVLIGSILAYTATNLITRPIHHLVEDTAAIATGDLNHKIRRSRLPELQALSSSIQEMIQRLKEMMISLQASEERLQIQNEELEIRVNERTAELKATLSEQQQTADALYHANSKLKILSSITRHDILNKTMTLRAYLELLQDMKTTPDEAQYLMEVNKAASAIERHIEFTREYEQLGVRDPVWFSLSNLIGESLTDDIQIKNECESVEIFADPMLEKVFSNLLDNTLRHSENATEIRIHCTQMDSHQLITWEDNGVGVPDNEKERIFDQGFGKNTGYGLFLIREILGITGLTIHETGVYGEGARFEIVVPEGRFRISEG